MIFDLIFPSLLFLISFIWVLRIAKTILFWLYLWQLKEYHIGRFLDHFNTEKGKTLLFNGPVVLKVILIFIFSPIVEPHLPLLFFCLFLSLVFIIYLFESIKIFIDFIKKTLKKPVWTKKTALLTPSLLIIEILFIYVLLINFTGFNKFIFWILLFDIITPLIVSIIVLLFQPLAFLGRNKIIQKAKQKREQFKNLLVIGITGSYGKTSTKDFLYTILSQKFGENKILKTKAHQNSEVGISQCILNDLKLEHEIFICEMGAYNRGGIKLLCDIVKPKIGILTGINEQHMATFGSQDNIIRAKFELIESLPEDGLAVMNSDNVFIKFMVRDPKFKVRNQKIYSIKGRADIWAEDIKVEKDFIDFRSVPIENEPADFKVNVLGGHNVLNILGATLVAKELGMNIREIAKACEKIDQKSGGMQLKQGIEGISIIDSTYSANPDGVISALEYLKIWPKEKVIVMPCLIELGANSGGIHRRIGKKIAEVCNLAIITTKDRFKEIKEGAINVGIGSKNILFIDDPKKIFEMIKSFCEPGDVVLLMSRVPNQLISLLAG